MERLYAAPDVADKLRSVETLSSANYGVRGCTVDSISADEAFAYAQANLGTLRGAVLLVGVIELLDKLRAQELRASDLIAYAAGTGYPKLVSLLVDVMRGGLPTLAREVPE